jgi:predicted metalloprotease with PDZ domain
MRFLRQLGCTAAKALALALAITGVARAASVQQNGKVSLPRFEVAENRGYFDFTIRYDDRSEHVEELKLTWVSPAAHKNSLRVGDKLVSVDGIPIAQLTYSGRDRSH